MRLKKYRLRKIIILSLACFLLSIFAFYNISEAKTDYPYYVKVNKQQNVVTVYEKDKSGKYTVPVKAMICSVGVATPLGTYKTPVKYRWKLLMGDVWGQYSTRIVGGILFHSVWYYKMDASTLSATQYNKLGTTASHGCVRLTVADAKWIYDNCPIGTTVEIYNDKNPGPLGKPEAIKLLSGTGWDPTDPNVNNPYLNKTPTITGAKSKSIAWGTKTDLSKGIKASSTSGTDITNKITTSGSIDVYKAGKYKIKYSITDALGKHTSKTITLTVKACTKAPEINGVTDKVVGSSTKIDRKFALNGVNAYLSTKQLPSSDIKVNITKKNDNVYTIEYTIKAENEKTAKEVATVSVDTTPPIINGATFKEISKEQLEASEESILKLARKGITVSDDYSNLSIDDVSISVNKKEDYAYMVTYKVADKAGNESAETVQFTYFPGARIEGITNQFNLPYDTLIDESYVRNGIMAINELNEECSQLIKVSIETNDDITYLVTYSLETDDGIISIPCTMKLGEKPSEEVVEESEDTGNQNGEVIDEISSEKESYSNSDQPQTDAAVDNGEEDSDAQSN